MARVPQIEYPGAKEEARDAHDKHQREVGRITNMKRTLLQSVPAFDALMAWYPLRDAARFHLLGPMCVVSPRRSSGGSPFFQLK